jgi:hypothetical protein
MITTAEITALNERLTKAHKANDALKVQREVHEKTLRDKARTLCDQGIEGIDPDAEITVLMEQIDHAFKQYSHDLEEQVSFNKKLLALVESGDYKGAEELLGTPSQGIVKAPAASVTESAPVVPAPTPAPTETTPSHTQGIPMIQVKAKSAPVTPRLTQPATPTVPADLDSILNDALFTYEMGN